MSDKDPSTVKEPVLKRLKVGNYSRKKMRKMVLGLAPSIGDHRDGELRKNVTASSKPLKEKTDKTKVNYSHLENLPNEILLKIVNYMNPNIKELLSFGHVSRRIRSVAHDQSLWQNVNLFPRRIVPAGLLQLILENGCKRINIRSQIVGTLTLNQESQLEFLNSWNMDPRVLTDLLASCHSLEQLHLRNVILNHEIISSICYQNGQTLKVLKLAHCKNVSDNIMDNAWIRLIIDNCVELSVLDLIDTKLSEESIEYMANNLTPTISKFWLTSGIKSRDKCMEMIKILENRCNNLTELKLSMFRWNIGPFTGISYGIGSQIYEEEQNDSKILENLISTFRRYE